MTVAQVTHVHPGKLCSSPDDLGRGVVPEILTNSFDSDRGQQKEVYEHVERVFGTA